MDLKIFNRYSTAGIVIRDPGLKEHINLSPIIVPRTYGRHAGKRFAKSKVNIVERLATKLMLPGHKGKKHWKTSKFCTGKAIRTTAIVERCLDLIQKQTNKNPIEMLVRAIENAAPREEVTMIEMGGIRVPKQVDSAPQRRVDLALRWLVQGTFQAIKNKKTSVEEGLASEIIAASNEDAKSFAISKKVELERQAEASK